MKKSELVTLVAEKTGFSKKDTEKTIDTVFTAIADIMAAGDKLQISGFGTHEELLQTNAIYPEVYESQTNGGGDFDEGGEA